jgi:lipoprotein NlpD
MFESVVFRDEKGTTWPVEGDRFTFSGKFPGIAIMGERGKPVMAVAAGRVIYSGPHSTLGKVTFVQHPRGYIYIYGGNETLLVSTGEEIKTGQQLGTLGITPVIQKPQLYFSVWKDGSYIDPASAPR